MSKVKTYNPKKVTASFYGISISGFAEDSFIEVTTEGDGIKAIVGCDQEVVRSIDPSSILRTITISLLQSSDTNALLSAIHARDNQAGDGVGPMLIKDLSGNSLMATDQAWISSKPVMKRGKSASGGNVEWKFQAVVADEAYIIGGHN